MVLWIGEHCVQVFLLVLHQILGVDVVLGGVQVRRLTPLGVLGFLPLLLVKEQERLCQVNVLVDVDVLLRLGLHQASRLSGHLQSLRYLSLRILLVRSYLIAPILACHEFLVGRHDQWF